MERLLDVKFNDSLRVVRGRRSGLLQFSKGEAVKILASFSSGVCAVWPIRENAVLGQWPKGAVAWLINDCIYELLHHHTAYSGII